MKKIQINVKEDVYDEYKKLCEKLGTSVAVEIRRFMRKEIERASEEK